MSVKNLDINPRYVNALLSARVFDVKKLLCYSKFELGKKTGLSENAVKAVFKASAESVCTTPWASVWDILNKTSDPLYQHQKLTTGCPLIDAQLKGGIIFPGTTEISGESASGKTQLCIQLCLNAQKSINNGGIDTGSLYICTEDVFPTKRLHQMAQEFCKSNRQGTNATKSTNFTDRIYIEHASDLDDLWSLLDIRLYSLLSKNNVKLIIIDSIAALFRTEFNTWELQERAKMLAKFGRLLHDISRKNNLCVVCVNQVSDVFDDANFNLNNIDRSRNVIPALGLTWSYYVNTRLMLSRTQWKTSMFQCMNNQNHVVPSYDCAIRSFKVVYAPHLPPSKSYFIVNKEGVKDFKFPNNKYPGM